ncbi:MAG UNVERIFIED_CONTAM: hypothetical protein LVR18_52305 [Planctomycetaceae bacterium]|jgi:hypothetical protein
MDTVLKFFCPLQGRRIRRNCGTRDRREARRIQRECRERLLSGEYSASGGAIAAKLSTEQSLPGLVPPVAAAAVETGPTWQDCYDTTLNIAVCEFAKDRWSRSPLGWGLLGAILQKQTEGKP